MTLNDHAERIARVATRAQTIFRQESIRVGETALGSARLNATSRLNVRTGRLRGSMAVGVEQAGDVTTLTLSGGGPAVRYARMQDIGSQAALGGPILPKGRLLAVPFADGLTPAGVARYASPRDVPGGFWMKSAYGNPIFARYASKGRKGVKKGSLEVLFIGLRSVVIKPTRFMSDPMDAAAKALPMAIQARMRAMMQEGAA